MTRGIPQGSRLGPTAFIVKINQLPMSILTNQQDQTCDAIEDQAIAIFMDDTILSEVIQVDDQLDGNFFGNIHNVSRAKSYKLLGIWLDNDLKWKLLKIMILRGHPMDDLLAFYNSVIRPILEYGVKIWNGGLSQDQKRSIE